MSTLPLCLLPDPVLREKSEPVTEITPDLLKFIDDMLETMYHEEGVGLAAPQVGVLKRVIVMDVSRREDNVGAPIKMINPEIISASEEKSSYEEGCLSIPQMTGEVVRPAEVVVRYMNIDGTMCEITATGLLATCVQHEIDHLDGKLFIDHMSPLKRGMLLRRYEKRRKLQQDD